MSRTSHVSMSGNDANPGTARAPVATLERARDLARQSRRSVVLLHEGLHSRTATFELGAADSGTTYRAAPGERARLIGGRRLSGFSRVTDPAVLRRLSPEARRHVVQVALREHGIRDFGRMQSRGFSRPSAPAHMELFFDGKPMTLARWPNEGEDLKIARVPEGAGMDDGHGQTMGDLKAGFFYDSDRPRRWKPDDDMWIHGYWSWDWANSYERVKMLDAKRQFIKTAKPYGLYGFRAGQRFHFLNVLEELDQPGEWYADRKAGMLYFWPPGPMRRKEVMVSLLAGPMIRLEKASRVSIEGLTLECTRGHAVVMRGGAGNRVAGCTIRLTGNYGVRIEGGSGHVVTGCEIHDTGDGGVEMSGGDRRTLKPGLHAVHNCHFYRQARWSKCYYPSVLMHGVGNRVSHNLIHDHPHCPILFDGNEHVIEFNEIHHVCMETGDVGAIYTGRDWTFRGNVVRHNFIHHTGGVGMGSMGVYLDDCVSSVDIIGNVFYKVQRAAFIGGGRDNRVENNIFVECDPAVMMDGRGLNASKVWHDMVYVTMKPRLRAVPRSLFYRRYPRLATIDPHLRKDGGVPPEGNSVVRNVCAGGVWAVVHWGAEPRMLPMKDNLVTTDPGFVDAAAMNFQLRPGSPAFRLGFKRIPFEKIGLIGK